MFVANVRNTGTTNDCQTSDSKRCGDGVVYANLVYKDEQLMCGFFENNNDADSNEERESIEFTCMKVVLLVDMRLQFQ